MCHTYSGNLLNLKRIRGKCIRCQVLPVCPECFEICLCFSPGLFWLFCSMDCFSHALGHKYACPVVGVVLSQLGRPSAAHGEEVHLLKYAHQALVTQAINAIVVAK